MKKIFHFDDPIMQKLVATCPAPQFEDKSSHLMESLIESIVSQQLSVKAADTIFARFVTLFNSNNFPSAKNILEMDDELMRGAGISYAKIKYIKCVANAFISDLIDIQKITAQTDEEVINELVQIKGVGRWTAEMTLIFTLQRPDVFSVDDNGLQRAITNLYGITDKKEMVKLAEQWKPYRSSACWYLWKSLEIK